MDDKLVTISKFLSLVLRHKPEAIGLNLDPAGWADVSELIEMAKQKGPTFDLAVLEKVVETNDKKRFTFFLSDNLVWLTDHVPAKFIQVDTQYTNQRLYQDVISIVKTRKKSTCRLEQYLLSVYGLSEKYKTLDGIDVDSFIALLDTAFDEVPKKYASSWPEKYSTFIDRTGCAGWEDLIRRQIVDLHEFHASGKMDLRKIFFGEPSPRGSYWHNAEPFSFIECAAEGAFHGWTSDTGSGRSYVTGKVAVLDEKGKLTIVDPRSIREKITEIDRISWHDFHYFLLCGQTYE
jgi:hypothetical protein